MGRHSCCYKQKLRKGLWSPEEDDKLVKHISKYGHGCWSSVPKSAGLERCGKSCRLRWINYLRPDLKRGTFSQQEENLIIELHSTLGNKWSQIAAQLPGRTDNEIKNLWNSSIKKKLRQRGIDPNTHKPLSETENEEKVCASNNKISDKASEEGSYELHLVENENLNQEMSKPQKSFSDNTSAINNSTPHEVFVIATHETSTTTKPMTSDYTGLFSFQHLYTQQSELGLSVDSSSSNFFFNNQAPKSSEIVSSATPLIHSSPISSNSYNTTSYFDQNNNNEFCWSGTADVGKIEKDHQLHSLENNDMKWTDCFQTPFLLSTSLQNYSNSQNLCSNETKPEAQALTPWHQYHQQNQQQETSIGDVYTKNFQRLSATFGHIS